MEHNKIEVIKGLTLENFLSKIRKQRENPEFKISLHPNGFLQIPLEPGHKRASKFQLHIWHPDITKRGNKQFEIHNHAYKITSTVLLGALKDTTYQVTPNVNGEYVLFECNKVESILTTGKKISLRVICEKIVKKGNSYIINSNDFHSSNQEKPLTVTLVKKTYIRKKFKSQVVGPINHNYKSIEVDRDIDQKLAWKIVTNILNVIIYNLNEYR